MSDGVDISPCRLSSQSAFQRWAAGVAEWMRARADHYAAAAIYERLNGLTDAELHRRGLNRSTPAHSVSDGVARTVRF